MSWDWSLPAATCCTSSMNLTGAAAALSAGESPPSSSVLPEHVAATVATGDQASCCLSLRHNEWLLRSEMHCSYHTHWCCQYMQHTLMCGQNTVYCADMTLLSSYATEAVALTLNLTPSQDRAPESWSARLQTLARQSSRPHPLPTYTLGLTPCSRASMLKG